MLSTFVLGALLAGAAPGSKSDAEGVQRVQQVGRCVARSEPQMVHELILTDHRSREYKKRVSAISRKQSECIREAGGNWRSSGLLYVGALAEGALHERRVLDDLAAKTAYDASRPPIETESPGDLMGYCIVRKDPAQVVALLKTDAASDAELAALKAMAPSLSGCVPANSKSDFTREALRALIALNAYRLYAHNGGSPN